ncbi:MAG: glycosyltransferase [Planctomycetota bacterium]
MKILAACPNEDFALGVFCKRAFEALKHNTVVFDLKQKDFTGSLLSSKKRRVNDNLIETVMEHRPDFLFVTKGADLLPDTIKTIHNSGVVTANWFPDDPYAFEESKKIAAAYDFYFTNDSALIPAYKEAGQPNIYFLPFCCDPEVHKKEHLSEEDKIKYASDISFVGQWNKVRQELLEKAAAFDIKVYGPGWHKRVKKNSPLYGKVFEPVYISELAKVYSASSIVLNIHLWYRSYTHGVNMRLFEASGCAAFQVCDFQEQISDNFIPDKEVVVFRNEEEFVDVCRRFLSDKESAKQIGEASQKRAYSDHTYEKRMKQVIDICSG